MKIIEIEVKISGETTITTMGFQGEECKKATKGLKAALGDVKDEKPTSEMFISNVNSVRASLRAGGIDTCQ
jgi:hypothetical protein